MRSPRRRRPRVRSIQPPDERIDRDALASRMQYVGSPEHKDTPSFAGHPRPRADATICDPDFVLRRDEIEEWLRDAMIRGCTGTPWEGDFPRYLWYLDEVRLFEARLVNRVSGEYKGYQLLPEEWPPGVAELYQ